MILVRFSRASPRHEEAKSVGRLLEQVWPRPGRSHRARPSRPRIGSQNSRGYISVQGAPRPLRFVAAGAPRLELRANAEHPPTCLGPDPLSPGPEDRARLVFPPCDQVRSGPRPRPADLLRQRSGRGLWAVIAPGPAHGAPRRHCARHRRTTTTPSQPTAPPRPPLERKRRALGPDDTPCTPSGHDQTCPGSVTVGNPRSTSPRVLRSVKAAQLVTLQTVPPDRDAGWPSSTHLDHNDVPGPASTARSSPSFTPPLRHAVPRTVP